MSHTNLIHMPIPAAVNTKSCIRTIADKERTGGYLWNPPREDEIGLFPKLHPTTGEILNYKEVTAFDYEDVDGRVKTVARTETLDAEKNPTSEKIYYGTYNGLAAGTFYGRHSRNFRQRELTPKQIVDDVLLKGYSVAPGRYVPTDEHPSHRSADTLTETWMLLADGDKEPHTFSLDELLEKNPAIPSIFTWVGESIKSRSFLNPEMRYRLMLLLPEPFTGSQADKYAWEFMVDEICALFPFIDRGVGSDISRFSFGNARPNSLSVWFDADGVTLEDVHRWKAMGKRKVEDEARKVEEAQRQKVKRSEARSKRQRNRGDANAEHPLSAFFDTGIDRLLMEEGCSHISGEVWQYPGSSSERSFNLKGEVIKPWSTTVKEALPPDHTDNRPIQAHRFVIYRRYGIDVKGIKGKAATELFKKLAADGFGKFDERQAQKVNIQKLFEDTDLEKRILAGEFDEEAKPEKVPTWEEQEEARMARLRAGKTGDGRFGPLSLQRPPAILKKPTKVQEVIELLESNKKISTTLAQNHRIVGLNAPTGAGKDEQHMAMVIEHKLHSIETKPHHRVAEEKTARWQERASAARWVGITAGMEIVEEMDWEERIADPFPEHGWKCIQPKRVWEYMQRGGNRHLGICNKCPVKDTCAVAGYNGQAAWIKHHRAIVLAIPQLFIDPIYESFSEKLYHVSPRDEDLDAQESQIRLAVMDEVHPTKLFLECKLPLGQLQIWRNMWGAEDLAVFSARIEPLILNEDWAGLQNYIESINENIAESICDQMHHVREPYELVQEKTIDPDTGDELGMFKLRFGSDNLVTLAVNRDAVLRLKALEIPNLHLPEVQQTGHVEMTLDQAFSIGVYGAPEELDGDAIQSRMPKTYSKEWNPLRQLQKLFERYPADGAPISLEGSQDAGILTWEVAPQLHDHIKRIICMSATLDEELFRRAFSEYADDLVFVRVEPTPLIEGSQIFQIRTGKYPRGTVLNVNGDRKLHGTGLKLWNMFQYEVLRDPEKTHALVTYQSVINNNVDWLNEQENIIEYANFFGLEGINSMQEADNLWVLFDPELNDADIRRYAKQLYGNDETALDFSRENGRYVDERVYRVWHSSVVGELLQAVGRARLNRVQGTIVLLTGVEIPSITNRAETLLFDLKDWEVDKNITILEPRIRQRELSEACFDAHEDIIMQEMEDGMSQREATRKYGVTNHWIRQLIKKKAEG